MMATGEDNPAGEPGLRQDTVSTLGKAGSTQKAERVKDPRQPAHREGPRVGSFHGNDTVMLVRMPLCGFMD